MLLNCRSMSCMIMNMCIRIEWGRGLGEIVLYLGTMTVACLLSYCCELA